VSASWIKLTTEYLGTRFPVRLYLPGAAFLAVAACAGGQSLSAQEMAWNSMLAWMLMLQFRIMDDLADIRHDRMAHRERVMAKAVSLTPFHVMLCGSFAANLFLVSIQQGPTHKVIVFLLLNAAAILWYTACRHTLTGRILGYHIVLGKYPVFVYLLSGNGHKTRPLLLALCFVYICFLIYEALHDRSLHSVPGITKTVLTETVALSAVAALMAMEISGSSHLAFGLQGLMSIVIFCAFLKVRQTNLSNLNSGYAVFILGFATVLNFSIGVRL